MKKNYSEELYKAYKDLQSHKFKDECEMIPYNENIYNILQEMTEEEINNEINFLEKYSNLLKKQKFYLFDDIQGEYVFKDEIVAFSPVDIYRLWIEKDMAIYDVISKCSDDYLQEVIEFWVASQYDVKAVEMLAHYKSMRKEFLEYDDLSKIF